jgi:hypothetical protein
VAQAEAVEPRAHREGRMSKRKDAASQRLDDLRVDDYVRFHFRREPVLPPDPLPARDDPAPSEDEQFAAYMRRHHPNTAVRL